MIHLTELGPTLRSGHERVVLVTDGATGLRACIAIHSTARGPAIGGCRIRAYRSQHAALRDVLRLSGAMSRRAALAGLPFGGGACVVMANPAMKTDAMLRALGEAVHRLGGNFIITADSGTDVLDLEVIRGVTPYARGLPMTSGEACPAAAYGTFLALQVAVSHRFGKPGLAGRRIAVQGLGKVGMRLCGYLAKAGARLIVADPDADRVAQAVSEFEATSVTVRRILSVKADVLTLNAFGDVICDAVLPTLRAPVIVGAANNQLRAPRHGIALDRRGILFVPDYVANAGSLIDVAMEGPGYSPDRVLRACESIWHHTARLLCEADLLGVAPSELAERIAAERMIPVYRNTFRVVSNPKAMA